MTDYAKELDLELKSLEKEIEETERAEEILEDWETAYNRRKEEIKRKVEECFEKNDEKYRMEERERENRKKNLSYKIPMLILKIFVFFLIVGLAMVLGAYYFLMALVISWLVGLVFVKIF